MRLGLGFAGCFLAAGCHERSAATPPALALSRVATDDYQRNPSGPYRVAPVAGGGAIRGRVKWTSPTRPPANPRLLIGAGDGVADAFVYLIDVKQGAPVRPREVVLPPHACPFTPRLMAAPIGSTVRASDSPRPLRASWQDGAPAFAAGETAVLERTGTITLRCDEQAQPAAFIQVRAHPYYAVTREDGAFELAGVAPGRHRIVMWHESWRTGAAAAPIEEEHDILVETGKTTVIDFDLR